MEIPNGPALTRKLSGSSAQDYECQMTDSEGRRCSPPLEEYEFAEFSVPDPYPLSPVEEQIQPLFAETTDRRVNLLLTVHCHI